MSQDSTTVNLSVTGDLKMVFKDKLTGEVIDTFHEKNVFLDQGKNQLLQLLSTPNLTTVGVTAINIGDDVGTGTIMAPQMATADLTEIDQNTLFSATGVDFNVSFPTQNSARYFAMIDGETVMASHPTVPNIVYTSATIRMGDGKAIAYRRFAPRTISSLISVDLIWTVTIN